MGSEKKSMANTRKLFPSKSFMIIKPEKASAVDLISLLFSSDLGNREFLETSTKTEESFRKRWIIFVSTVAQILLKLFSKPMAWTGFLIETWLNFLSHNSSIFDFIINLVKGTLIPDRDSADFTSFIGYTDNRKELARDIEPGDESKYYSSLCMMTSKASYENEAYIKDVVKNCWNMEFLGFYNCWNEYLGIANTPFFLLRDKSDGHDTIVVTFRGTAPFNAEAWSTDVDLSSEHLTDMGHVHQGFMKALGMQKGDDKWPIECKDDPTRKQPSSYYFIRDMLKALLSENENTKFIVTGHSLGGALAILFPAILFYHNEEFLLQRLQGVYTYGQPRVGDKEFGDTMMEKLKHYKIQYFRFVYCNDMVPRLPYDDKEKMFKHFGNCLAYNSRYHAKIVQVLPNKNYFNILYVLPKNINAFYELVRSFTIQYVRGPDYKEGWLLRFGRMFGLVIPGISAHSPQDYVNSTRLGSADVPEDIYDYFKH